MSDPDRPPAPSRLDHVAHPWHGISPGDDVPHRLLTYIEMVPMDTVKYELDKHTGHLRIDRPQRYSALCPTLYGFVPRTLCAELVAEFAASRTGRSHIVGDGDPLDVCVLAERPITRGGILVTARPIGGLRMFDNDQADDKIVAVLEGDSVFGGFGELSECPERLVDRLRHYFLSYKDMPDSADRKTEITDLYDADEALEVIRRSLEDYRRRFGDAAREARR